MMTDFSNREVRAYGVRADRASLAIEFSDASEEIKNALRRAQEEGISTDASTEDDSERRPTISNGQ